MLARRRNLGPGRCWVVGAQGDWQDRLIPRKGDARCDECPVRRESMKTIWE